MLGDTARARLHPPRDERSVERDAKRIDDEELDDREGLRRSRPSRRSRRTRATFAAGAVTLRRGVPRPRSRESLDETYKDNPEHLAELREQSPEGGFADEGVTIHVFDADDGHEYLRFDVFDDEPHYHYIHNTDATAASSTT